MDDLEKHFGSAVREIRGKRKLSQEEFAHKAGIHRTYASSVERGRVQVSIVVAMQIADALNVSLSSLFRTVERIAERDGEI